MHFASDCIVCCLRRVYQISQSLVNKKYDSVRVKDVELIRERLTLKPDEIKNMFSVLTAPRGIRKTVAIETAETKNLMKKSNVTRLLL